MTDANAQPLSGDSMRAIAPAAPVGELPPIRATEMRAKARTAATASGVARVAGRVSESAAAPAPRRPDADDDARGPVVLSGGTRRPATPPPATRPKPRTLSEVVDVQHGGAAGDGGDERVGAAETPTPTPPPPRRPPVVTAPASGATLAGLVLAGMAKRR